MAIGIASSIGAVLDMRSVMSVTNKQETSALRMLLDVRLNLLHFTYLTIKFQNCQFANIFEHSGEKLQFP